MKNVKFSVATVYNRKKQLTKQGTALIQIVVTLNGKRKYFSTNVYVTPDQWNERQRKIKNHPNAAARNNEIYNKIIDLENFISSRINKGETPTLQQVENFVKQEKTADFISWLEVEAENINDVSKSTKNHYRTLIKHLKIYQNGKPLFFEDVTFKYVTDFYKYLSQRVEVNTSASYMKKFKKFVTLAIHYDLIDYHKDPFKQFKIKTIDKKRDYLTAEELKRFEAVEVETKNAQIAKDMFLFSCYTGLRFVDVHTLTESDIITSKGETYIYKVQDKTDVTVNIPISSIADGKPIELLRKHKTGKGYFNGMRYAAVCAEIKKIAAKAGITKRVTYHTARHTNATYMLNSGVSITSVQKLLGHKSVKTTMIYAETLAATIKKEVESVKW
jgi:integrase